MSKHRQPLSRRKQPFSKHTHHLRKVHAVKVTEAVVGAAEREREVSVRATGAPTRAGRAAEAATRAAAAIASSSPAEERRHEGVRRRVRARLPAALHLNLPLAFRRLLPPKLRVPLPVPRLRAWCASEGLRRQRPSEISGASRKARVPDVSGQSEKYRGSRAVEP